MELKVIRKSQNYDEKFIKLEIHDDLQLAYSFGEENYFFGIKGVPYTDDVIREINNNMRVLLERRSNEDDDEIVTGWDIENELVEMLKNNYADCKFCSDVNMYVAGLEEFDGAIYVEFDNHSTGEYFDVGLFDGSMCNVFEYGSGENRSIVWYGESVESVIINIDNKVYIDECDVSNCCIGNRTGYSEAVLKGVNGDDEEKYFIYTTSLWSGEADYLKEFDTLEDIIEYIEQNCIEQEAILEFKNDICNL